MTHKKDINRYWSSMFQSYTEVKFILFLHVMNRVFKMEMEKRWKINKQPHEANQLKNSNFTSKIYIELNILWHQTSKRYSTQVIMLKILVDEYHPTANDNKKDIEDIVTIKILHPKYIPRKYKWKSLLQRHRKNQEEQ